MNKEFKTKNWLIGVIAGFLGCTIISGSILSFVYGLNNIVYPMIVISVFVCGLLMGKEGAFLMIEDKVVYKSELVGGKHNE